MQLKKHIKRTNYRTQPCRHCGGKHKTGEHAKALVAPVVAEEDE